MEDLEQRSSATEAPEELTPAASDAGGAAPQGEDATATPAKPPRTRLSAAFQALLAGAVVLILLLIFILENTEDVKINFLGAKGHISLGIALLLAAAGGALLVAIVGAARISQLRLHVRRERRRH